MTQNQTCPYKINNKKKDSGNYGTIYDVRDKVSHRLNVVKIIKPKKNQYFREVDIACRLQHPHLIHALDLIHFGKCDVKGIGLIFPIGLCNMSEFEFYQHLTVKSLLKIFYQIGSGLDFLHRNNIYHLDIKPQNIILMNKRDFYPLIIDFGGVFYNLHQYKELHEEQTHHVLTTAGYIGLTDFKTINNGDLATEDFPSISTEDITSQTDIYSWTYLLITIILFQNISTRVTKNIDDYEEFYDLIVSYFVKGISLQSFAQKFYHLIPRQYHQGLSELLNLTILQHRENMSSLSEILKLNLFAEFNPIDKGKVLPPLHYPHDYAVNHREHIKILFAFFAETDYLMICPLIAADLYFRSVGYLPQKQEKERFYLVYACILIALNLYYPTDSRKIEEHISKEKDITKVALLSLRNDVLDFTQGNLFQQDFFLACTNLDHVTALITEVFLSTDPSSYSCLTLKQWKTRLREISIEADSNFNRNTLIAADVL